MTLSWVTGTRAACGTTRVGTCQSPSPGHTSGHYLGPLLSQGGEGATTPRDQTQRVTGCSEALAHSPGLPSTPARNLEPGSHPASTILGEPLKGPAVHTAPSLGCSPLPAGPQRRWPLFQEALVGHPDESRHPTQAEFTLSSPSWHRDCRVLQSVSRVSVGPAWPRTCPGSGCGPDSVCGPDRGSTCLFSGDASSCPSR